MELLANATLQRDTGLLTTVGHLVDEQVGTPAEALATLCMLVLQQL